MKDFSIALVSQFAYYLILTLNYRAIGAKQIGYAMVTDGCAVAFTYFIVHRMVTKRNWRTLTGMVIGGSVAAAVGILLTEHWG